VDEVVTLGRHRILSPDERQAFQLLLKILVDQAQLTHMSQREQPDYGYRVYDYLNIGYNHRHRSMTVFSMEITQISESDLTVKEQMRIFTQFLIDRLESASLDLRFEMAEDLMLTFGGIMDRTKNG
jgi:hypothetical protein